MLGKRENIYLMEKLKKISNIKKYYILKIFLLEWFLLL